MGRPGLPSISKIEDVLDLLLDPEKYIKYLRDFRLAYDEAKSKLEDLQTKEAADVYLAQAHNQQSLAEKALTEAAQVLKNATLEAQTLKSEAQHIQESAKIYSTNLKTQAQKESTDLRNQQTAFEHSSAHINAELIAKQAEVEKRLQKLIADQSDLDIQRAKFKKALE